MKNTTPEKSESKADDFTFATIRRKKYPEYYMGWVVENNAPKWTSCALDAAPVPLEILIDELNKVSARETNIWAVIYPQNAAMEAPETIMKKKLKSDGPLNAADHSSSLDTPQGAPYCRRCGGLGTYEEDIGSTIAHMTCPCTYQKNGPLRVSYSRAEIADKLEDWMIELWGDSPKKLAPEQRDQWHRDNGMIYHFICDHFPPNA
jgi:hypothetical protein